MFSLKKIASVVMATAMAVTTAVPGTAIVANAETTTIKTRVKNSDKKQNTINAADMNKLSINTENATVTYSSSLATDNAAAKWAKKEMKDSEKPKLGTPIAGKLNANKINDSNNGYWIKYSGITLNGAEKGEKYDLKVSVEEAHGAISGADGPYIAFHKKSPTSIRYSGYQWIVVTYTLTDAGKSTLASTWKGNMTFWDIDSYQGLEIRTPGRVTWAGLSDDSHLGFNIPDSRLPSASVKDNTVYSNNGHDATDGAIGTHAQQHALYLQTQLTPANNKMKIRFFTGGKDGKQPNGVFLSFDARNRSGNSPTIINFPLTKTVNGKSDVTLANSSDSFEYTLSTMCGNAVGSQIKSFVWNDTLESVLEFTGNSTVIRERDGKTENVTGDFTVKTNGQVLTATANKLTDDEMRGKFTLHFHAKVKAGANLSKYLNADKTEVVIPNKGTLTTKQDSGTKTNTSNTVNVRMKMAKLAVDKVVDQYEHKVGDTVNFT
ncbi:isopeptide-forming domain-containing fimbrial protein, partial [Anaerobutyricum hallii]